MPDSEASDIDALAERLFHAKDEEEQLALRTEWATRYPALDEDALLAPALATALLVHHRRDRKTRVYAAGCGTEPLVRALGASGFGHVVGADPGTDHSAPLALESGAFGAALAIGLYTDGSRDLFLEEMMRILAPGGTFVFTVRPLYWEREVEDDIESLVCAHAIDVLTVDRKPYAAARHTTAWYACLRKRR